MRALKGSDFLFLFADRTRELVCDSELLEPSLELLSGEELGGRYSSSSEAHIIRRLLLFGFRMFSSAD